LRIYNPRRDLYSTISFKAVEIATGGNIGFVVAEYSFPPQTREKAPDHGLASIIWRNVSGQWLIHYLVMEAAQP